MSALVIALTLAAAVAHAAWNALLRGGNDRLRSITLMSFVSSPMALALALVLPSPAPASWPYIGFSAALQVAYAVVLAYAYDYGELGQVYPFIRGSIPLLVTLGGFTLAGQRLNGPSLLGIALVCGGIASLGWGRSGAPRRAIPLALATALFAAIYVTLDGLGVRLAGNAEAYVAWIFLLYGALLPLTFLGLRRRIALDLRSPGTIGAVVAGALSLLSYGAFVTALSLGKLGPVSALRETSVVFSVFIGRLLLAEPLTRRRLLACLAVASGAACIAYAP